MALFILVSHECSVLRGIMKNTTRSIKSRTIRRHSTSADYVGAKTHDQCVPATL